MVDKPEAPDDYGDPYEWGEPIDQRITLNGERLTTEDIEGLFAGNALRPQLPAT